MSLKRAAAVADHGSMRARLPSASDEAGYTLVELMVAAIVLVVGMMGAFMLLNGANRTTVSNNARMGATNLARELLEDARSVDYDKLTDAAMVPALQAKMGVTGNPNPWTVQRRGIKYTVATDVCTFDDPKDNVATTPPADVCTPQAPVPASAGTLTPDIQPDDFRRVTVTMTWDTGRGQKTLSQVALVNNPAGGLGPRITTFTAPPDNVNQLTSGAGATFPTVTTGAGAVRWNTDGTPNGAGDSTGGPTTWTTAWQLGTPAAGINPPASGPWPAQYDPATTVLDGTYTVTAQAFDDRGIAGDTRVAVLPLNRSLPITVTGFEAGRSPNQGGSGALAEFRWDPNPERDIIGYRVYDAGPDNTVGNGNDTDVCGLVAAPATSCTIAAPASNRTYFVVAVDRNDITQTSSAERTSQYAKPMTLTSTAPPAPSLGPVGLGNSLSWTHPDGNVRYYRIYRDTCCAVADRYDRTSGNVTTWVDPNPGTGPHTYWVSAVGPATGAGAGYNESVPSFPVVAP